MELSTILLQKLDTLCCFAICKPYLDQKGSHNSIMPCQGTSALLHPLQKAMQVCSGVKNSVHIYITGFLEAESVNITHN